MLLSLKLVYLKILEELKEYVDFIKKQKEEIIYIKTRILNQLFIFRIDLNRTNGTIETFQDTIKEVKKAYKRLKISSVKDLKAYYKKLKKFEAETKFYDLNPVGIN